MKERGILFSAPMVLEILADRKRQTRRMIKDPPGWSPHGMELRWVGQHPDIERAQAFFGPENWGVGCPYGKVGDRLYVKETHGIATGPKADGLAAVRYFADDTIEAFTTTEADKLPKNMSSSRKHPSIYMPRWASRITLEITGIRVERLQDISEEDAKAEGVEPRIVSHGPPELSSYVLGFKDIWWEINGGESWHANPWVWVIDFKRLP